MAETKTQTARRPVEPATVATPEPLRQDHLQKLHKASAALVFVAAFILYVSTLAPTVTLVDSGELIVAARTLGVAHPPGFPLYVLLAHLATYLPVGDIATRIHLASALFAALAAAMMTRLAGEMLLGFTLSPAAASKPKGERKGRGKSTARVSETPTHPSTGWLVGVALPLAAGLLFATSRTLWAYATIAEVYTINTLLIVTIFFLMLRWRRAQLEGRHHLSATSAKSVEGDRHLYLAALLFGLALGVHHVTVGLMLPALAALVFATEGIKFFTSRRLLYAALCAFLGLSVYAYLPLAAARAPLMNWGDPQTFERFWWHITGRQYQVFFDLSLSRIGEFFRLSLREFGPAWLPLAPLLAVAGFVSLFKNGFKGFVDRRAIFFFLLLIVVADVVYCLGYEIDEDKDAYYLPAFVALTLAAVCGARWLLLASNRFGAARLGALLLLPVVALAGNLPYNNRSRYFIAHDYVSNILNTIEPGGMLLTNDWQVYSPFLYVHHIENRRGDVVAIDVNQLRRSWYFDYLRQAYPELINKSSEPVQAFLEDLVSWEKNPDAYAASRALTERINTRFYDMILSFVANHIKDAPVYATLDVAIRGGANQELTQALNERYKLIPQGLLFRVSQSATVAEGEEVAMVTRGLGDGSLRFEEDDVVMQKVYPVYLAMLTNRGRYLALQNQHERAIDWFQQALVIDANYEPAKRALAASQAALQKPAAPK